jgi:hypothetical protein
MAKSIIKENHPLNDTPLPTVFPVFKPCSSCLPQGKVEEEAHHEPLLTDKPGSSHKSAPNSLAKKKTKPEFNVDAEAKKEDPFLQLGFGMIAYRDLMFNFIILFAFLSILMAPAMKFYSQGEGYAKVTSNLKMGATLTLGNLGYSTTSCSSIPLGAGDSKETVSPPMQCLYGTLGQVHSFGVNPPADVLLDNTEHDYYNDYCDVVEANTKCYEYLD